MKAKIKGQNSLLKKYGLITNPSVKLKINEIDTKDVKLHKRRLNQIEAKFSQFYFKQIFQLIPWDIRPERRRGYKTYDGVNNLFNLAYEVLAWKVHRALINAKLEPYLGFLHSEQFGKPSLVCDFQELYRFLIDDFAIEYCQKLAKKHFTTKTENFSRKKKSKRLYLNDMKTRDFSIKLNLSSERSTKIPRIRVGKKQTIETLISEESLLFAKFLRNDKKEWIPRLPKLNSHLAMI